MLSRYGDIMTDDKSQGGRARVAPTGKRFGIGTRTPVQATDQMKIAIERDAAGDKVSDDEAAAPLTTPKPDATTEDIEAQIKVSRAKIAGMRPSLEKQTILAHISRLRSFVSAKRWLQKAPRPH